MKSTYYVGIIAALLLSALFVRADEASYAAVVKERDSVLSQIVAERESRRSSGTADEEAIAAAQLALYAFRRDTASTTAERIKNQELILAVFERRLDHVRAKMSAGLCGTVEALEARAAFLEAKQILEQLRLEEKKG